MSTSDIQTKLTMKTVSSSHDSCQTLSTAFNFLDYIQDCKSPRVNQSQDEINDRLQVMLLQEQTIYQCSDYIGAAKKRTFLNNDKNNIRELRNIIDGDCRRKMTQWCYKVVEFTKLRREIVEIAMSYLDRYLSSNTPRANDAVLHRKEYQLVSMTALYMAVKLFEQFEMEISLLSDLSHGCYSEIEFSRMETEILSALSWRMNGPTALTFVEHFLALLPRENIQNCFIYDTVLEHTKDYLELAVQEYYFVTHKPSTIAIAAILNALETTNRNIVSFQEKSKFLSSIVNASNIDLMSPEIDLASKYLSNCFNRNAGIEAIPTNLKSEISSKTNPSAVTSQYIPHRSPICVSRKVGSGS